MLYKFFYIKKNSLFYIKKKKRRIKADCTSIFVNIHSLIVIVDSLSISFLLPIIIIDVFSE